MVKRIFISLVRMIGFSIYNDKKIRGWYVVWRSS